MEQFINRVISSPWNRLARVAMSVFLLVIVSSSTIIAQAKPKAKSETELNRIMRIYTVRLKLTKDQQARFRPVMESHLFKRHSIMEKYKNNHAEMRKELISEKNDMARKLGQIVTKEQMSRYKKWQSAYANRRSLRHKTHAPKASK